MRSLFLISIFVFLASCNPQSSEPPVQADKYWIDFLEKSIRIPKGLKKMTLEEYSELVRLNANGIEEVESAAEKLEQLSGSGPMVVFADEKLVYNSIVIQLGEYIPLDVPRAKQIISFLNSQLIEQTSSQDLNKKLLEKKFMNTGAAQIIKFKYSESAYGRIIGYATQYLITYKGKTFAINIKNTSEDDYQFILQDFMK